MNSRLNQFAAIFPGPLKQCLKYAHGAIPFNICYGEVFRETYKSLQESQWWNRERLEEYQLVQLSKVLDHAYENVPYYRRMFDERRLKPRVSKSLIFRERPDCIRFR